MEDYDCEEEALTLEDEEVETLEDDDYSIEVSMQSVSMAKSR